ncbi:hypothetical protein EN12_19230 [Vibrio cholerae]|uniref:Exodeoxyribonuclease I n=2 Tax=Vibrio TaxID=662 RepID=A0A5B1C3U8_VIBCL|nr:exodeoxyribonuclease I [Vibrio cholerae]AKO77306.1 hypothetical protein EN12_19230 [Vibrio cholerae]KAA1254695.1 exodeoxyribonuclease I [Vibrio cholerae]
MPIKLDPVFYESFFVYDYETAGLDKNHSQPVQGAWIYTDSQLNIIQGSDQNVYCKMRLDVVPSIDAFMITKIDPKTLEEKGVSEYEFAKIVQHAMQQKPNTCISGYNTMAFDDEVTRNLMFRNNRRMYDHEWKNNNGRVDFYNLLKMTYAYFPNLINFPHNEEGKISLKLEDLCRANNLLHESAHDALSDVIATVQLAKLIRDKKPRLFDYFLKLSSKNNVKNLLTERKPMFYTERVIDEANYFTTLIYPLVMDPKNNNAFICVDLTKDPTTLINSSAEEIQKLVFTKRAELPEDAPRLGLHSIKTNKQPIIKEVDDQSSSLLYKRFNIDREQCDRNLALINEAIKNDPYFLTKLQAAFESNLPDKSDVYGTLYSGGFLSNNDMAIRDSMHHIVDFSSNATRLEKTDVYDQALKANDKKRIADLLLRSKWNTHMDNLLSSGEYSKVEFRNYLSYVSKMVSFKLPDADNETISSFKTRLKELPFERALTDEEKYILKGLERHVAKMESSLSELREIDKQNESEYKVEISGDSSFKKFTIQTRELEKNQNLSM